MGTNVAPRGLYGALDAIIKAVDIRFEQNRARAVTPIPSMT